MPDKSDLLLSCAPITEKPGIDRAMRMAMQGARHGKKAVGFGHQQAFDAALARLVHEIPVDAQVAEWFANENLIPVVRRRWKKILLNPVVIAIALALLVIGGVFAYRVREHLLDFPGADKARRLLTVGASSRSVLLDPLKTEAGALSDFYFMKHRLEHYDVPAEFADFKTLGTRVFDDDEVRRVAQIWVVEKRMQFFLFPAEADPKTGRVTDFSDWRFVELEGWTGAVTQRNGVCFMAAIRGREKDLQAYLDKKKQ
jgi:PII-like signaling protein